MNKVIRFLFAMVVGVFMTAFAFGVSTVSATENQSVSVNSEQIEISDSDVAQAESADDGSSVFLLMGGMLLIIIAVVVTVAATVVVTAPIADEV